MTNKTDYRKCQNLRNRGAMVRVEYFVHTGSQCTAEDIDRGSGRSHRCT